MQVITRLTVSGPSIYLVAANQGLDQLGWQTLLVHGSVEEGEEELDLVGRGLATHRIRGLRREVRPLDDVRAFAGLVGAIRRFRPHVVHTHQSKAGLLARTAAAMCRVPVRVHTFHGTVFQGYFGAGTSRTIVRVERALARLTHRLIVLGEAQRAELLRNRVGSPDKLTVLPLGTDLSRFGSGAPERATARRSFGIPATDIVLLAVGRFAPIKRLDRLLRVLARVHRSRPETRLYLLGDGPLRSDLERLARELGVEDAVVFAGWSDRTPEWYAAADIVVNASDNEGTPLALIEAAGSGRPVVATRVGGVPDVVIEGQTGLLVAPDDERAFADGIERLAANADERAAMGRAAAAEAHRFGSERQVRDLHTLYEQLLALHDPRREPPSGRAA